MMRLFHYRLSMVLSICLLVQPLRSLAQSPTPSTAEVQHKIARVEENLVSWAKLDSTRNWTLAQRMQELGIPGVSIAVINHYRLEWVKSYGWADTTAHRPATNRTLFQAASIGKSLHAVACLRLVEKGQLDLHTDIATYLCGWALPMDSVRRGRPITLAHLLSHTAGLTVHGFDGYQPDAPLPTLLQTLNGISPANNPAVRSFAAPGSHFEYSGGGYEVSELLVEQVTGQPYALLMRRTVLRPLRMHQTTYDLRPPAHRTASGYRLDGHPVGSRYHLYPEKACGAGLWTTAADLAHFVISVQRALRGDPHQVLRPVSAALMTTPMAPAVNYGLGTFVDQRGDDRYFYHSGLNEGFSSAYCGNMQNGTGVVVLTNSDNTAFVDEVINSVATVYDWKGFYPYATKKLVTVPDSVLARYVGQYRFKNENIGPVITLENSQLYLAVPGSARKWRMYFTSPTEFFMLEAPWANQRFYMDDHGRVQGHYIIGHNHEEAVPKVN